MQKISHLRLFVPMVAAATRHSTNGVLVGHHDTKATLTGFCPQRQEHRIQPAWRGLGGHGTGDYAVWDSTCLQVVIPPPLKAYARLGIRVPLLSSFLPREVGGWWCSGDG
ncbi:hypothetical protein C8R45DRAFT_536472 [Mycena sanguinolenta]|nr:hypothetical protein C8R45DRAFT_536472 [Mycena sanguinolenta]